MAFGKKSIHWDISQLELSSITLLKEVVREWMFQFKGIIIKGDNSNVIQQL